jgi:hypothetical protein
MVHAVLPPRSTQRFLKRQAFSAMPGMAAVRAADGGLAPWLHGLDDQEVLPLQVPCPHKHSMSGVFSIAAHSVLQYLPEVVSHEQTGCAHFCPLVVSIFSPVVPDFTSLTGRS